MKRARIIRFSVITVLVLLTLAFLVIKTSGVSSHGILTCQPPRTLLK